MTALGPFPLPSSAYVWAWLAAFAFTQLVEIPIYRRALGVRVGTAFGATLLTHPLIWFVLFPWVKPALGLGHVGAVVVAELWAWLGEAAYFAVVARVTPRRAIVWSLVANASSVALGLLSRSLFGGP